MKNKFDNQILSVVVPVYNEIKNVQSLIMRFSESLQKLAMQYEIIFIDDNSTDGTKEFLDRYQKSKRIRVYTKQGKAGKAFSLMEGFKMARGGIIVMIDGDLQYPPEAIPDMVKKLNAADIVVANRKKYNDSKFRKIMSRSFRYLFGKLIFGLNHDIQSGLKVFTREVIDTIKVIPTTGWTFDLEFLHKASHAGFVVKSHDIDFSERKSGTSKVGIFKTSLDIGLTTLSLAFKKVHPQYISPQNVSSMIGAGIGYKRKKYITHTILPHQKMAMQTLSGVQKIILILGIIALIVGVVLRPWEMAMGIVGVLSLIYFADVLFNLYIILKSLHVSQEIGVTQKELDELKDSSLPIYSILCPLYKEAHVIPQFLKAISKMDYPKAKLDVMLLLEEDDVATIYAVSQMNLPSFVRVVVVPDSIPKTKPKACNYGLWKAKGEYIVIYDAEDIPDVKQLKKAYLAFQKAPKNIACLQAKLNYYNPNQNLLTRFFTAEYSLWFDITLTGLQSLQTTIPLGGTSNHFQTQNLKKLQGWDPFNVTEDADLGVRLFKQGYKTAMIDSTTLEEANSKFGNWIRQRSRWLKGYMQTYIVHMRDIFGFARTNGIHALFFQLVIGLKITFILINPLLWIATISYFALYSIVGPTIEALYPSLVFYMAAFSLIFGNFLFLYYYMIGVVKRGNFELVKYVFLIPFYWLMISIACSIALYQLIFKPHYWEKTVHGFHLQKIDIKKAVPAVAIKTLEQEEKVIFPNPLGRNLIGIFNLRRLYLSSGLLIAASVVGNILNLGFNSYIARLTESTIDIESFTLIGAISGLLYVTQIPFSAVASSVNYRTGFLETRFSSLTARTFWQWIQKRLTFISLIIFVMWIAITPLISTFLKIDTITPLIMFSVVWLVGFIAAANMGYLSGQLRFGSLALLIIVEPIVKFGSTYFFATKNLGYLIFTSIPLSILATFILSTILSNRFKPTTFKKTVVYKSFPKKFFMASFLSSLSLISFLSLDIILAKHYLPNNEAGIYILISLVGKIIFYLGTLSSQFVLPFVSRSEGAKKDSDVIFQRTFFATLILTGIGVIVFGLFGHISGPILFGNRIQEGVQYLLLFSIAMMFFTISKLFITYYQAKKIYSFSFATFLLAIIQIVLITKFHGSIESIVSVMGVIAGLNLITVITLHLNIASVKTFELNIYDLVQLILDRSPKEKTQLDKPRILIFNWRDTKHVWAGGAELYMHELARRWTATGIEVTMFCGNDQHNLRNQTIDGVRIVRRGGAYTVYMWAFLYYVLKFRGKFDVIIDSENGIPFFTPLFARIPVFLLIHHIHQDVFRKHLKFPLAQIASLLEGKVMPFVYKNNTIVTVSESSKQGIVKLGLAAKGNIEIVHPGIENSLFSKTQKTANPSFLFVGRLKPYKNVDVAVKAFAQVLKSHPKSELSIVGDGDRMDQLILLTKKLKIDKRVTFYGKVTEEDKVLLLGQSWAVVQPSELEGWGITVIEANACGTPVIASNVHGLRDSVVHGQTGVLVEAKNIDEFAKSMNSIITDVKFKKFLSYNAHLWSHNFSWDLSAEKFYSIIIGSIKSKYGYKTFGKIALINQK